MNMWKNITNFVSTHTERIVVILAVILSVASFAYYYHAGLITAYGDSRTHLDMARRVIDSPTPGLAQVGGYWLPLLHVLMLPTIWNDFMWQSGLSGSIPNMIAFVAAVLFMYRLAFLATGNRLSAFIGASILLFNPNLLYMQATPMTESLFVCTITVFMFYFYRWFRGEKTSDLVLAAIFLVFSSLNRYEGWGLVIAANALMVWRWAERRFDKKMEGAMIAFGTLSFFGIFLWLLWGAVIFGDPLIFANHELSAATQTSKIENTAQWTGFGNIVMAILTNMYSVFSTAGMVSLLAIFGVVVSIARNARRLFNSEYLMSYLLLVPILFDILTVYTGKVPVENPIISHVASPHNIYNVRYALYTFPFLAIFTSVIARSSIGKIMLVSWIICFNIYLSWNSQLDLVTLRDVGISHDSEVDKFNMEWLAKHHGDGLILVSAGAHDGRLFNMKIDQAYFITEGAYKLWDESLHNPAKYAEFVLMSKSAPRDMLNRKVDHGALEREFHIVKMGNDFDIFQRNY